MSADKGTKRKKRRTRDLLKALRHGIRRILLRRFIESEEPLSPARLAKRTKYPLATVSYHVGVLRECGTVSLVDEPARDASERRYESTVDDDPTARAMLEEAEKQDEESRRRAQGKGKPQPRQGRRRRPL